MRRIKIVQASFCVFRKFVDLSVCLIFDASYREIVGRELG
jgi:hypothetical protein